MNLSIHLRFVGASLIALSFAHVFFARRLQWRADAGRLTPINRQIFYVHAFFICLTVAMMGTLCLLFPQHLLARTPLARLILIGLVTFWATRLIFQWFVYDSSLWRGHRDNTIVHVAFTLMWSYYVLIFAAALRSQF
jgi:hypothetical protein